ncbi:hypothetical protein HX824_26075 [Pseudomonas sp. D4002]|uniref:hypothetical protein n=1 Tax=Pseudomonas sp. D4002 TaxID=2738817 RepID=UPI0015A3EB60|nr:hypothetical protein [Pseudomonas sp. D4002]NWB24099.1 hypothetical protein [Pseudomonas sp. D4002]
MKKFIFLVAVVSLCGCTSMKISHESADRVPASRIYNYSKKSDAQLAVMLGSRLEAGCGVRFLLDGKPAADFYPGEIAYFGLTLGAHFLEAQPGASYTKFKPSQAKVNMKSGDALLKVMTSSAIESVDLQSR